MNRRFFAQTCALAAALPRVGATTPSPRDQDRRPSFRAPFSLDAERVRFTSSAFPQRVKCFMMADTHLFIDDERGEPYRRFSARMAKAYNQTKHFQTGAATHPNEAFVQGLALAKESGADLVALIGDIFSFPSEAAVEWTLARLAEAGLPFAYVAGNHDWHYEGMEGSLEELRQTWIERRLKPLYQGRHPLMSAVEVRGIRFLFLDNSHYEILPGQLEFFREQVRSGNPLALMVHIPLYAPGRSVGFGCGHPEWGAKSDRNFELERRPRWPEGGHTEATKQFHREVFAAPNLAGVFAGHIHRPSLDVVQGIPQFVMEANATGAFMTAEFIPESKT